MPRKIAQKCSEGNSETSEQKKNPGKYREHVVSYFHENPIEFDERTMRWLIYAPEYTKDGLFHWQTFIYFKNQMTGSAFSKKFSQICDGRLKGCHSDKMRGSLEDQLNYIRGPYDDGKGKTKPYNPEWKEFGSMPKQGERTDLDILKNQILRGDKTVDDICIENPIMVHQYGRTLDRIEDISLRRKWRTEMTKGIWLYGGTGKGKTHYWNKVLKYSPETHYLWQKDEEFQCGYKQQKYVIIDEFRTQIPFGKLLELVNDAPYSIKRKGREPIPFKSDYVIVTSPCSPEKTYNNALGDNDGNWAQFLRRFEVYNVDEDEYPGKEIQQKIDDFLEDHKDSFIQQYITKFVDDLD